MKESFSHHPLESTQSAQEPSLSVEELQGCDTVEAARKVGAFLGEVAARYGQKAVEAWEAAMRSAPASKSGGWLGRLRRKWGQSSRGPVEGEQFVSKTIRFVSFLSIAVGLQHWLRAMLSVIEDRRMRYEPLRPAMEGDRVAWHMGVKAMQEGLAAGSASFLLETFTEDVARAYRQMLPQASLAVLDLIARRGESSNVGDIIRQFVGAHLASGEKKEGEVFWQAVRQRIEEGEAWLQKAAAEGLWEEVGKQLLKAVQQWKQPQLEQQEAARLLIEVFLASVGEYCQREMRQWIHFPQKREEGGKQIGTWIDWNLVGQFSGKLRKGVEELSLLFASLE